MANVTQTAKYAPEHVPASAYTFDANPRVGRFRVHNSAFASLDVVEESLAYHQGLLIEAQENVRYLENILKEHEEFCKQRATKNKEKEKEKEIDEAEKRTAAKAKAKANSKGLD